MCFLNLTKYEKSIDDFTKSLELDHNLLSGYINRAQAFIEKKNFISAVGDLSKALQLTNDSNTAILSLRAFAYTNLNRFGDAISDVSKMILNKEENKLSERLHQRALLWFKLGKTKEAVSDLDMVKI
jgi:tetratricopeptide (TPR) repeat protein